MHQLLFIQVVLINKIRSEFIVINEERSKNKQNVRKALDDRLISDNVPPSLNLKNFNFVSIFFFLTSWT